MSYIQNSSADGVKLTSVAGMNATAGAIFDQMIRCWDPLVVSDSPTVMLDYAGFAKRLAALGRAEFSPDLVADEIDRIVQEHAIVPDVQRDREFARQAYRTLRDAGCARRARLYSPSLSFPD